MLCVVLFCGGLVRFWVLVGVGFSWGLIYVVGFCGFCLGLLVCWWCGFDLSCWWDAFGLLFDCFY